jgi:hypothetical protein
MVTRSSTSRPFQCLCMAERTKSLSVTLERKSRLLELIPRFNVRDKRAGQTSEWVRIPSGLPSITYYNNKKEDTEITILAL